ncbi:hypothetical protein HK100_002975 [Physocladia obscura]|uniref:Peptidase M3A/M3B catalytic domain-containing protein n=1 Tax=Physocladia obscura TaxID=109957 RepID=A0AAD5XG30_9FUNG|nr:hypothetical protein HK100_002975 [Physocladia obscura]
MNGFRKALLEQIVAKTPATAQAICGAVKVAAPGVGDGEKFVGLVGAALAGVALEDFDAAVAPFLPGRSSHAAVRLRHNLPPAALADLADEVIARSKAIIDAVANIPEGTHSFDNTIRPLALEDKVFAPLITSFDFPQHVSADKAVRDASSAAETKYSAYNVETSMRKDVFESVKKYASKKEKLSPEDQRLVDRIIRDFSRNGLDLSVEKQTRITQIKKELSELGIQFQKNLGEENTKLEFTAKELDGMPPDFLEKLDKTADGERFIVGLKYTEAPVVLKLCHVEATRKVVERAFNSRCKEENASILQKLVDLRQEQAALLGFPNHAAYILDVRMAKSPETVQSFLRDLNKKLQPLLDSDIAELLALKKKTTESRGEPFDGKINYWDTGYYLNLIEKEKYQVDHEEIKRYFPLHVVTNGLFEIYQRLLGLRFEKVEDAQVWHPDVQMYAVYNASDDKLIGYFYMDLHPREGKYGHAAVFGLQPQSEGQLPACSLVCNFSKPTATTPSLLLHSEVVTYFHEFGHCFHQICSNVKWARFAGTSVERDFVECPSQMLENWCWEPETLQMLAGHIDDSTRKIPDTLLENLIKSKNANSGYSENRQLLFGLFDQAIHGGGSNVNVAEIWPKIAKEIIGIPVTEGTYFPAAFGHLAGGYDAQYYGYMWSQVYATDMFYARFKDGNKLLDAAAGGDYRKEILAVGGSRDAIESLRVFLGREPNQEAFLKSKGL